MTSEDFKRILKLLWQVRNSPDINRVEIVAALVSILKVLTPADVHDLLRSLELEDQKIIKDIRRVLFRKFRKQSLYSTLPFDPEQTLHENTNPNRK